jgi:hypothetical protein
VLVEHRSAQETEEGAQTLDMFRIGADGSPHWLRVWPTPEETPRRAGLELRMAGHGYQIVRKPASCHEALRAMVRLHAVEPFLRAHKIASRKRSPGAFDSKTAQCTTVIHAFHGPKLDPDIHMRPHT